MDTEKSIIHDPKGILKHEHMSLEAGIGYKVTVTDQTIEWGYDHHKEQAKQFLKVGEIYTVEKMDAGDFSSRIQLKEIPNETFNSVHFIDVK